MLLQDCFFIQRNYTALYNRMAVLFIAKSTAMLIAAHARSEDMILVTNNVREFARVPDLVVENWAK